MQNIKKIKQDGVKLVLDSDTQLTPSTGTQASNISAVTTAGDAPTNAVAINSIIDALEGVGILASS